MATSYVLDPIVEIEFSRVWEFRLQQMGSLLLPTVSRSTIDGDRKRFTQLGAGEMRKITGRSLATHPDDSTIFARWIVPEKFERVTWVDEWDQKEIGQLPDPVGPHMEQHVMAYGRTVDAVIRDAVEGQSITGDTGTTLVALPSSQIVLKDYVRTGAAARSGLTFAKVGKAKRILDTNKVPLSDRYAVISSQEQDDLVQDVEELKNSRYTNVQPITDGTLDGKTWMGFKWIVNYEDLTVAADSNGLGDVRNCLFYHKSFVVFGDGERRASVDLLPLYSHSTQVRTRARMGATRKQEEAVVVVETYHVTGA
jgi:hypothetical protein